MKNTVLFVTHEEEQALLRGWDKLSQKVDVKVEKCSEEEMETAGIYGDLALVVIFSKSINLIEIIKTIRRNTNAPILAIQDGYNGQEKMDAIRAGADEYIQKSCELEEDMASAYALIRRYTKDMRSNKGDLKKVEKLTVLSTYRKVYFGEQEIDLSRKEYDLLVTMLSALKRVFTFEQISYILWGDGNVYTESCIRSCVNRIRRKLEQVPNLHSTIENVHGVGYRFCE